MSIDITKLTDADIGRWVEYKPLKGQLEKGRIKSWNDKWIFVVYKCDKNWNDFKNYTAAATNPKDLTFCKRQRV